MKTSFITDNLIYIIIGVVILLAVVILIIILAKKKKPAAEQTPKANSDDWYVALGGKDNVVSSEAHGSRLIVKLKEPKDINVDSLKALGVSNIVTMSDKITLILENQAEQIKKDFLS